MAVYAAVTGIETLIPASVFMPGLTVQLCMALPNMYRAVRERRANLAVSGGFVTMFWLIAWRGALGIRETMIITQRSTVFAPMANAVGKLIDRHVRGSANSQTLKYKILFVIAQFVRAAYQVMGYPLYDSATQYGHRFASEMSGHLGSSLATVLAQAGRGVVHAGRMAARYPTTTGVGVSALLATMLPKKQNSPRRASPTATPRLRINSGSPRTRRGTPRR